MPSRSVLACCAALLAFQLGRPAFADRDSAAAASPSRTRDTPVVAIFVGAAGIALLASGGAVLASSYSAYDDLDTGSRPGSCRPCSESDLAGVRGRHYAGISLMAVGGGLLIADAVLLGLHLRGGKRQHASRGRAAMGAMGLAWAF